MVSFGPWQQDSDQLKYDVLVPGDRTDPVDGQPIFDYGGTGVSVGTPYQDPRYQITAEDLEEAVYQASPPGPEGGGGSYADTFWGVSYSWGYQLAAPNWQSSWSAASVHRWFRIAPAAQYFYSPVSEGYWATGAIGIDYETQPYDASNPWAFGTGEIKARALSSDETLLGGTWESDDGMNVPYSPTELMLLPYNSSGEPLSVDLLSPPSQVNAVGQVQYRGLNGSIDITDLVRNTLWGATVWTRQDPRFAPPASDPGSDFGGVGRTVRYGWGLDKLRVDTMVRPPRWRWVFKDDSTPYRRIFPRDDSLAGGAARTFPRPRSAQGSNRTSGGYL